MSTNTLTFDESPPRRPGLDDVGGGQKVNDGGTPDPIRDPTAEDANQTAKQLVAIGKVNALNGNMLEIGAHKIPVSREKKDEVVKAVF